MSLIPPNEVTVENLMEWYKLQEDIARLKSAEALLRMKIFKNFFPAPVEGTNTHILPDGYALKGVHKINRKILRPNLVVLEPTFREKNLPLDSLIKYEPELVLKEYRTLTKEQLNLFDQCMEIKDGMPDLKITLPAKR
jgi:hypothetical protein